MNSKATLVETGLREAGMIKYAIDGFLAAKVSLISEIGNVYENTASTPTRSTIRSSRPIASANSSSGPVSAEGELLSEGYGGAHRDRL